MTKDRTAVYPDPQRIFEALARHKVDYVVIGGLAVIAHGHTRNTRDVDLIPATARANVTRLAAALRELGVKLSGIDAHLLDVQVDVAGAPAYAELRARAVVVELDGVAVPVAGLKDLILMKRASGRPQDLSDIAALTAPDR